MYKEVFPKVEHGIISRIPDNMYGYHGWPSIAKGDDGTLYAVCSGNRMSHVCPFGKTHMFVSRDEGKTWTPPIVVNDTPLDDRDAGIVNLGNGKLLVTWFRHPAKAYLTTYHNSIKNSLTPDEAIIALAQMSTYHNLLEEDRKGGSFVRLSRDNGVTWGDTVQLPVSAPHGPIVLDDGTLLYLGKEHFSDMWDVQDKPHCLATWTSSDDGLSWQKLGDVEIPEGYVLDNFHEPHAVQLKDGRILGVIRAQNAAGDEKHPLAANVGFTMFTTWSLDGGKTWSDMQKLDVSGSPPHLLLHSSGAIICAFGRREKPFGERALVSKDNGETWEEYVLNVDGIDGDLGYPASVELSDGSVLTMYYQKAPGDRKCSILYTKWNLE